MNDKLRRAIKTGIIDEDYKDYLAVEKIPHDFSEKYEQRIGELIKTNRKSGHRHIKITLRFAAAIIAAVLAVGSVTVAYRRCVNGLLEFLYRIIIKTLK